MGRIAEAVRGAVRRMRGEPADQKSLRDASTTGDALSAVSGNIAIVRSSNSGITARLFRKQNVRMLRAYAEYSTVLRAALDIYRNAIAQAEWQIIPHDPKQGIDERVKTEIEEMLHAPNPSGEPYSVIKEKFVEDYLVIGHGAIEKAIRRDGSPYNLFPIDAAQFAFTEGWDGTRPEIPRYGDLNLSGQVKRWIPDAMAMVLVNRPRSYDSLGLSHVEVLDIAVRALLEGDDTLLQQVIERTPGGALDLGEGATQQQVDETRAQIQAVRKAFIVMGGSKNPSFVRFDASEREIRLLDKQVWFVRQVAAIFQLPMAVLGQSVDTSRANTEAMLENADTGPGALLWRIRGMENSGLVQRFGKYSEHNCALDYPIMSKRDEKSQAEISKTQTGGNAWASINDARRAAGMPAIENVPAADDVLIPTPAGPVPLSALNAQYFDGDKLKEREANPTANDGTPADNGTNPTGKARRARKSFSALPFEHLVSKSAHKFSSTQLDLPEDIASLLLEYAAAIPDDHLAADGREGVPHVTIKYGLDTNKASDVATLLKDEAPVVVKFGETSCFESDDYDVVIVEVKGAGLHRLNKLISDALECTDTHPEYIPHATLAYVEAGKGALYAGDDFLSGKEVTIDEVVFSSKLGKRTTIPLKAKSE